MNNSVDITRTGGEYPPKYTVTVNGEVVARNVTIAEAMEIVQGK